MERYQNVVRLNFFGHVHSEQHNVVRSYLKRQPVGVQFWTGAMTTYKYSHPCFRRFIIDAETFLPLRVETYTFNVTTANAARDEAQPQFELSHELTNYFDMDDLSP